MGHVIFFFKRVGFFLASVFLLGNAVHAENEAALIQQVERLSRQLSTLERQIYRGEIATPKPSGPGGGNTSVFSNSGGASAPNSSQLQTMEHQIQRLTASLEEAVHKIDLQSQEIKTLKNDMQFRVDELEKKANQPLKQKAVEEEATELPKKPLEKPLKKAEKKLDSKKAETSAGKAGEGKLPDDSITDQYNSSLELLKKKEYAAALKAFEVFLDHHGTHELAGPAQYWLGEVHFAMKDYVKSSVAFLNAYKDYPNSTKRADSLLKLGQSLAHLGKKKEACATLQKLLTDFPKASATLKQMAESEKTANGC